MKTTNENEVQDKRSLTKGIIAIACACALALVGVFAYLTATDQVKNIFGFTDKLDIEVVEPNWNPDNAQNLLPTQSVTKDPALHNPNKADVYVFADVVIPQKDIVTANADGTLNESAVVDLFSYAVNDGWTLKDTIPGDDGTVTYRYAYNEVIPAGETSGSIFDEVAIVNYVNEQFNTEELAQQIIINAYGAQAVGFANADEAYAAQFGENEKTFTADITVNGDYIVSGRDYFLLSNDLLAGPMCESATATEYGQVVFKDVSLVKGAQYSLDLGESGPYEHPLQFTADESLKNQAASNGSVVLDVKQITVEYMGCTPSGEERVTFPTLYFKALVGQTFTYTADIEEVDPTGGKAVFFDNQELTKSIVVSSDYTQNNMVFYYYNLEDPDAGSEVAPDMPDGSAAD